MNQIYRVSTPVKLFSGVSVWWGDCFDGSAEGASVRLTDPGRVPDELWFEPEAQGPAVAVRVWRRRREAGVTWLSVRFLAVGTH